MGLDDRFRTGYAKVMWPTMLEPGEISDGSKPLGSQWFAATLTSVYVVLELINIRHHAMWADEMQVWSFAEHSHSLRELHHLTRYEGHPEAWSFLVYFISRFSSNPVAMQFLHLAIAVATVYVIARYSPFSHLEKVLIVFGYFFFFEYATISRDYALGIFGLFSFCAVFRPGPDKPYIRLGLLLALMSGSNIYALILALSLALMILFEALLRHDPRHDLLPRARGIICAAAVFFAATCVSLAHMRPPADIGWSVVSDLTVRAYTGWSSSLAMIWKAFVPIPQLSRQFWNTNFLGDHFRVMAVLSIFLLGMSVLFFIGKKTSLFLWAFGLAALLLFKKLVYTGLLRHDGHVFMLFLACVWLSKSYPEQKSPLRMVETIAQRFRPYQDRIFLGLLAGQVIAALIASAIAFKVPFSQAKATADFLRSKHMDRMFIVGDPDFAVSSIAGYLGRDIYYPEGDRMGSYVIWDRRRTFPTAPALELARTKAAERHQDVVLLLNAPDPAAREIASFTGAVVRFENYYLYLVPPEKQKEISSSGR
jgi:hypothetical protein